MNNIKKKMDKKVFSYSNLLFSTEVRVYDFQRLFAQSKMQYFYDDTVAQDTREEFLMSVMPTCQISNEIIPQYTGACTCQYRINFLVMTIK